jgi:hypothetical protein
MRRRSCGAGGARPAADKACMGEQSAPVRAAPPCGTLMQEGPTAYQVGRSLGGRSDLRARTADPHVAAAGAAAEGRARRPGARARAAAPRGACGAGGGPHHRLAGQRVCAVAAQVRPAPASTREAPRAARPSPPQPACERHHERPTPQARAARNVLAIPRSFEVEDQLCACCRAGGPASVAGSMKPAVHTQCPGAGLCALCLLPGRWARSSCSGTPCCRQSRALRPAVTGGAAAATRAGGAQGRRAGPDAGPAADARPDRAHLLVGRGRHAAGGRQAAGHQRLLHRRLRGRPGRAEAHQGAPLRAPAPRQAAIGPLRSAQKRASALACSG